MPDFLAITGPIFLLIGLGIVAVRTSLFPKEHLPALGGFLLRFCLPAMLFRATAQRSIEEVVEPRFLLIYGAGSLVALAAGLLWARALRQERAPAAMTALGTACPNSVFIGFPIAQQLVGPDAAVALALALMVENFLLLPVALALADSASDTHLPFGRAFGRAVLGLRTNPFVMAIFIGFAVALLQVPIPQPVTRAIDLMAAGASGAALFYIGGTLVGLKVGALAMHVGGVAVGKLVLHPLAVLGALMVFGPIAPHLQAAMLVFAGSPMLGSYAILGQKYGQQALNAASLLVATVASFMTLGVLISALQASGLTAG